MVLVVAQGCGNNIEKQDLVVYADVCTKMVYARSLLEFMDGRFVLLNDEDA